MNRLEVLETAKTIISKDRNSQYGEPENNFQKISELWTAYLGEYISSVDVANMMCLFKIARIKANNKHEDSYTDVAGYIACAAEIATEERGMYDNF